MHELTTSWFIKYHHSQSAINLWSN